MRTKKMLFVVLFLVGSLTTFAQSYAKGDNTLGAGIGVGFAYYGGMGGIPLYAAFDHGFTDDISGGLSLGYWGKNYSGMKFSSIFVSARASYHLNKVLDLESEKLDVYTGGGLSYRTFSVSDDTWSGNYGSGVDVTLHFGARYWFNKNFGAFGELGYDIAYLKLGVAIRL